MPFTTSGRGWRTYLYVLPICSKVYLATRPPTTMGFTCSLYTCPCLYAPNTRGRPERQNERERTRRVRERDRGQIEHEPVPHLLPRMSRIQLAVSTSGPANDLPNFTIPGSFGPSHRDFRLRIVFKRKCSRREAEK